MANESEPKFNPEAYIDALKIFEEAAKAGSIGIDYAKTLATSINDHSPTLRLSLGTDHYETTLGLLSRLTEIKRTSSNGDFVDSVPAFAKDVLQDVDLHIEKKPEVYLIPTYRLARSLSEKRDPKLIALGTEILNNHFDRLLVSPELTDKEVQELIKQRILTADEQQFRSLVRAAITPDSPLLRRFPRPVDSLLNLSLLGTNTQERPVKMAIVLDEITGGNAVHILDTWDFSAGKREARTKASESIYFDNFSVVCQLEKNRPGISKLLMKKYGVVNFTRYPLELLIEQFDKEALREAPYGVLITAGEDNGVALNVKRETENLYKQAKEMGYGLKVLEADTLEDILTRANDVADNHGEIAYMLILGHNFEPRLGTLPWRRDLFSSSPIIGLISCLSGKEGGAAQNLSSTVKDIEVHAPEYKVFLKEQGILFRESQDGQLKLDLLFSYAEGNFNTEEDIIYGLVSGSHEDLTLRTGVTNLYDVPTRVYRNGQFVRDYTSPV
jgi:hypothetical protein